MLIVGDPDKAFKLSFYPNDGVGLMRIEFIITHSSTNSSDGIGKI